MIPHIKIEHLLRSATRSDLSIPSVHEGSRLCVPSFSLRNMPIPAGYISDLSDSKSGFHAPLYFHQLC